MVRDGPAHLHRPGNPSVPDREPASPGDPALDRTVTPRLLRALNHVSSTVQPRECLTRAAAFARWTFDDVWVPCPCPAVFRVVAVEVVSSSEVVVELAGVDVVVVEFVGLLAPDVAVLTEDVALAVLLEPVGSGGFPVGVLTVPLPPPDGLLPLPDDPLPLPDEPLPEEPLPLPDEPGPPELPLPLP